MLVKFPNDKRSCRPEAWFGFLACDFIRTENYDAKRLFPVCMRQPQRKMAYLDSAR